MYLYGMQPKYDRCSVALTMYHHKSSQAYWLDAFTPSLLNGQKLVSHNMLLDCLAERNSGRSLIAKTDCGQHLCSTRRRDQKDYITDQLLSGTNVSDGAFSVVSGQGLNIEVILGGGGAYFHPPKSLGRRDYYQAFAGKGYSVALNRTAMYAAAADPATSKLLGIFHESNMDKWRESATAPVPCAR